MEQKRLYYTFHKPTETIYMTFVLNMPGPVAEMMEAKLKADVVRDMTTLSLAQLYQMAMELIQSHCRTQELKKHMKHIKRHHCKNIAMISPTNLVASILTKHAIVSLSRKRSHGRNPGSYIKENAINMSRKESIPKPQENASFMGKKRTLCQTM